MEHVFNFGVTLIAFLVSMLVAKMIGRHKLYSFLSSRSGRYGTLDGLRGYLALSVVFHHYVITWYWKVGGSWGRPPEDYFQNYGKIGVAIFFMITGFLFISKVMGSAGKLNWFMLYESRIFRIFPLYIFAVAIISVVVLYKSGFELIVTGPELVGQYLKWLVFMGGTINNFDDTRTVIAGVDWTLKYEWVFYLMLPMLAALLYRTFMVRTILLLLICAPIYYGMIQFYEIDAALFVLFIIGGFTAYLNKRLRISEVVIKSNLVSSVAMLSIVLALFQPKAFGFAHAILLSVFFVLIVLGNDMYGVFSHKSSVLLGEISYSIYLLHGLVLYLAFSVFDIAHIQDFSLQEYLLFLPLMCVVVITVSAVTFIYIENPGVKIGRKHLLSNMLSDTWNRVCGLIKSGDN